MAERWPKVLTTRGDLNAIHRFGKWCGGSQCACKKKLYNPSNLRRSHGWCLGSEISAQGRGRNHPDHTPTRASQPVSIPTRNVRASICVGTCVRASLSVHAHVCLSVRALSVCACTRVCTCVSVCAHTSVFCSNNVHVHRHTSVIVVVVVAP
jgi:hypothetical protein